MSPAGLLARVAVGVVALSASSTVAAQDATASPRYTLQVGAGYATWSHGLLSLPVLWTTSAPEVTASVERSSDHVVHNLSIGFGRTDFLAVDGVRRPGRSTTRWLPIDYHLAWLHGGRTFGISNLQWGVGPTARFLGTTQSVETDPGRSTSHRDRYVGAGVNAGFRWHDARSRWTGSVRASITVPVPGLSRWRVRSDVIPGADGALFSGELGLHLEAGRRMGARWLWGVSYERDSLVSWRSTGGTYSPWESTTFGSCLLTHFTAHAGYQWRSAR